ncbi:hypothetical protein TeGR_g3431, partial [Tetraparma gracilis]
KITPMLTRGGVSPITKQASGWKTQVKAIDESEGLKPEALEQMKKELKRLQGKVVANIEKELKAASDKGEEERGVAFAEANELIACINADARRLHGDSAKVIGSVAKLGPGLLVDAAERGDIKMVRELLAAGADVNHTKEGDEGRTALYKAAWKGHLEAAQALIDAGADVDKAMEDGETPLTIAAFNGRLGIVKALVGAKANVNKCNFGETPLEAATHNKHTSVAEYLKSVGAEEDEEWDLKLLKLGGTSTKYN